MNPIHATVLIGLALTAGAACAAGECRYLAERSAQTPGTLQVLNIGEVRRERVTDLLRLRNLGAHDIRALFDGAPPRQLARGQSEPAQGAFSPGVSLASVECVASRSVAAASPPIATTARIQPFVGGPVPTVTQPEITR